MVNYIRHVFKWAVSEELILTKSHIALATVTPLKKGRIKAPDHPPVTPVPEAHLDFVKPHVRRDVWRLIQLPQSSEARGVELVNLRPIDLDTSESIWTAASQNHKKAYMSRDRALYFGPQNQKVLRKFMNGGPLDAPMFMKSSSPVSIIRQTALGRAGSGRSRPRIG